MLTTNVLPWMSAKRAVALVAALVLSLTIAFAAISNSWTATAAPEDPANVTVVVDDDMTLAGPSWTWFRVVAPILPIG